VFGRPSGTQAHLVLDPGGNCRATVICASGTARHEVPGICSLDIWRRWRWENLGGFPMAPGAKKAFPRVNPNSRLLPESSSSFVLGRFLVVHARNSCRLHPYL
jgi:hypothetical protein